MDTEAGLRVCCSHATKIGLEVIKLFSCSTQLNMKFILLINVRMPTIVGILTFVGRIITASESFKARKILTFQHFRFYGQLKFHAELSMKIVYNLGAWFSYHMAHFMFF